MDARQLSRLQEEQRKAIVETDAKIDQLNQFKKDYKALQARLETLPLKLSHDIMVPFGKLAFMPGRIVHTNEILVLLGDNWFVERSASQAAEIAGRRIKDLNKKLKDLKDQRQLLVPRVDFTYQFKSQLEPHDQTEVKEIVEEYDEEKEKLWDEQHRKNVRRYKMHLKKAEALQETETTAKESIRDKADADLWSRLDELEKQEMERREMSASSDNDESDGDLSRSAPDTTSKSEGQVPGNRRVSWADQRSQGEDKEEAAVDDSQDEDDDDGDDDDEYDDDDDDDDDETDEEDVEEGDGTLAINNKPVTRVIRFKHTPTPAILPYQVSNPDDMQINSPADIYKLYAPKSILKKNECESRSLHASSDGKTEGGWQNTATDDDGLEVEMKGKDQSSVHPSLHATTGAQSVPSPFTSSAQKAFTGLVVEKPVSRPKVTSTSSSINTSTAASLACEQMSKRDHTGDQPPRRVSKFKAARASKNPS